MSDSEISTRGGQPSITTPMPPPCDSPKVVTRKSWPNVLPIAEYSSTAVSAVGQAGVSPAVAPTKQARTPAVLTGKMPVLLRSPRARFLHHRLNRAHLRRQPTNEQANQSRRAFRVFPRAQRHGS